MIEIDFDVDVVLRRKEITITHRCYVEPERPVDFDMEDQIATRIEQVVEQAAVRITKPFTDAGWKLRYISKNPKALSEV